MRNGGKLPLMQDGGAKSGKDTAISTDNTYDGTADPRQFLDDSLILVC